MERRSSIRLVALSLLLGVWCWGQPKNFIPSVSGVSDGKGGIDLTVSFQVKAGTYLDEAMLTVDPIPAAGVTVTHTGGDAAADYDGKKVYRSAFKRLYKVTGVQGARLRVAVGFQGCVEKDGLCLMPETEEFDVPLGGGAVAVSAPAVSAPAVPAVSSHGDFTALADGFEVVGAEAGYKSTEDFLGWLDRVESGSGSVSDDRDNVLFRVFHEYGLWLAMLLLLPLGLMLNLTPCVLPMIPVNLAVIGAGAKDGKRGRGFVLGLSYGIGMAFAYGLLGVVVVLTGSQFGALNSSGWFNVIVALVFVFLGLAMFDVFSIDLSRFRGGTMSGGAAKGKVLGVFLLGAMSAVLAGACVAPVLIWVLVLATDLYSSGSVLGLALPFMLGIGMALPWPLLGAGLSKAPRPGMWMVRIRQLFGVLILCLAVYYGYVGYSLFRGGASGELAEGWTDNLVAGLARAQAENRPVLIDFWGKSCKNCKLMDEQVFPASSVVERLDGYVKVKFLADDTSDSLVSSALRRYDVKGFPTFIILRPKSAD